MTKGTHATLNAMIPLRGYHSIDGEHDRLWDWLCWDGLCGIGWVGIDCFEKY